MNKAMMFPIHKKWVDMIFDGSKQFEFRNKLPKYLVKGMKIYFYETLGKIVCGDYLNGYIHEGQGMIVGEATVGEIYSDFAILRNIEETIMIKTGWNNHFYAIELTNVIKYDEEWISNTIDKMDIIEQKYGDFVEKLLDAPNSPIPKEEFVKWNKIHKRLIYLNKEPYREPYTMKYAISEFGIPDDCYLMAPPQAPMYVVEREVRNYDGI